MSTSADRLMPEVVEVEPLQRCLAAVGLQPRRVLCDIAPDRRFTLIAWQLDTLGEALEMQRVAAAALQAEKQVHRAFEQVRENHRSLRKARLVAEEHGTGETAVVRGGRAIADDHQDLAALDALLELHRGRRAEVGP